MAIEVTDVGTENQSASASPPSEELLSEERTEQQLPPAAAAIAAPRARGRPVGSKDRQPRKKRPARAASSHDLEEGEEEKPPSPRPLTRRSTVRRVWVVEESDSEEEAEEETPPPSPRTRRHQEWTAYRQQKADAHRANVNHYATIFDRMLA